jgi:hypothetical protein
MDLRCLNYQRQPEKVARLGKRSKVADYSIIESDRTMTGDVVIEITDRGTTTRDADKTITYPIFSDVKLAYDYMEERGLPVPTAAASIP